MYPGIRGRHRMFLLISTGVQPITASSFWTLGPPSAGDFWYQPQPLCSHFYFQNLQALIYGPGISWPFLHNSSYKALSLCTDPSAAHLLLPLWPFLWSHIESRATFCSIAWVPGPVILKIFFHLIFPSPPPYETPGWEKWGAEKLLCNLCNIGRDCHALRIVSTPLPPSKYIQHPKSSSWHSSCPRN
jgi:hypothetical protein